MPNRTPSRRPIVAGLIAASLLFAFAIAGCDRPTDVSSGSESNGPTPTENAADAPDGAGAIGVYELRKLTRSGHPDEAEQAIRSVLIREPTNTTVMVLAAEFFQEQGRFDEAVEMLDDAAELSGENAAAWRLRAARVMRAGGENQRAIGRLRILVAESDRFDEARHTLVDMLNEQGFRFEANEHVRELCRRGKATATELRGLIFPARSFTGFESKPSVDDADQIRRYGALNVARAMHSESDMRDAARVLRDSSLVQQGDPEAIAFWGQTLVDAQLDDAIPNWLGRVDARCKDYPAYWIAVGDLAMRQRDFNSAIRAFAEAIMREPGDLTTNDRMMQALAAGGKADWSERFRQRGVLIDRSMQLAREIFTSPALERAVIDELSRLLQEVGRPAEALAWYRIVLSNIGSPPQAVAQLDRATTMLDDREMKQRVDAQRLCDIAIDQFSFDSKLLEGWSTRGDEPVEPLESRPRFAEAVTPAFVNVAAEVGLDFRYRNAANPRPRYFKMYEQTGGGVGCLDMDLDGNVDLYVGQAASDPPRGVATRPNLMARNLGSRFVDVTVQADCDDRGYTGGVTAGDWNQDGFPDLVVANMGENTLFLNQGDGTFVRHGGSESWGRHRYTTSVAIGDVTGDHLPDIVEVNYLNDPKIFEPIQFHADGTPVSLPAPLHFRAVEDRVFVSRGDGSHQESVLVETGSEVPAAATGLGVLLTEMDDRPGNEIFVANDHLANQLWRIQRDASASPIWQNIAALRGVAFGANGMPMGCMGIAADDFDGNGRIDMHVTNFEKEWSNQYMQDDDGFFDDRVVSMGLDTSSYAFVGFGTQAIDYDNNRSIDLVVGQGHIDDHTAEGRGFEMPTMMFTLQGNRFRPQPVEGDPGYWDSGHLSRALATCDWNRDGRMDFVVTDLQQPLALLENRTSTEHGWIEIELVGRQSERDAIGAKVSATIGGRQVYKWVQAGDGYMCENQSGLHFGLGEIEAITRLTIHWPGGREQTVENLNSGQRWLVIEGVEGGFRLP